MLRTHSNWASRGIFLKGCLYIGIFALTLELSSCGNTDFVGSSSRQPQKIEEAVSPAGAGDQEGVLRREQNSSSVESEGEVVQQNLLSETFVQGVIWQEVEDFSQVNIHNILDILLVVDNSNSMAEEHLNLATKLSPLLSHVKDSDWRIGITTTDPAGVDRSMGTDDDCMEGVIKPNLPDFEEMYESMIEGVGVAGTGNEQGINTAINALKGGCGRGKNWLRSDSTIAVIIISDEDNCSIGAACPDNEKDLTNYLRSIRPNPDMARVYAIVGKDTPSSSKDCPYAAPGDAYINVVKATGGIYGDICDRDYSKVLNSISKDMSTLLKDEFALLHNPLAKVRVYENDIEIAPTNYKILGNSIKFLKAPANGSIIKVKYIAGKAGAFTQIALQSEAEPGSVQVHFNDDRQALVAGTDYFLDKDGRTIRFAEIPATETKISVTYMGLEDE